LHDTETPKKLLHGHLKLLSEEMCNSLHLKIHTSAIVQQLSNKLHMAFFSC